jgi:tryptophanyl-tRNA synthetase
MLDRGHAFKDAVAKGIDASVGLYTYPLLMAADILAYDSNVVPVGKDQKQHLEVARDIGMRFNHVFGDTFVIPEPAIEESVATVPGIDGQKMSKSYGNTIPIFSEGKQLKQRVMAIQTDSTPVEEPKNPDTCNLYNIFKLFAPAERLAEVRKLYVEGGAAYGYIKLELVELIEKYFKEARLKRAELLQDRESLKRILARGALKARAKAAPTLDLARQRVGLKY